MPLPVLSALRKFWLGLAPDYKIPFPKGYRRFLVEAVWFYTHYLVDHCPVEENASGQVAASAIDESCMTNQVVRFDDYLKAEGLDPLSEVYGRFLQQVAR